MSRASALHSRIDRALGPTRTTLSRELFSLRFLSFVAADRTNIEVPVFLCMPDCVMVVAIVMDRRPWIDTNIVIGRMLMKPPPGAADD
jgi:hypothetical protein